MPVCRERRLRVELGKAALSETPEVRSKARAVRIGFITGDGNPLDAWGGGTFVTNLPQALSLLDASPDHDIIVFCRDNSDDPAFDTPELYAGSSTSSPPRVEFLARIGLRVSP
jgi:hypothetical protein